jgi:5-formyltetrahydrofolate cyclo-ligase
MPVADEKSHLRAILRRTRGSIAADLAAALSARIQSSILAADFYRNAEALVLYSPAGNEVSTGAILEHALSADREVYYPRVDGAHTLALMRVRSRSELAPGAFGILEPPATAEEIDPGALPRSLVIVPGVGFSPRGERLGRGGGHYDRLLTELSPQAITVGLAYSFQLLDRIPQSGFDRRLNFVVTESAVHPAPSAREQGALRAQGGIPR